MLACLLAAPLSAQDAKKPDDPGAPKVKLTLQQRINEAIERGVAWLKKAQHEDGSWGACLASRRYGSPRKQEQYCHYTGPTTFSAYTLLKCGVARDDPVIKKSYAWLRERCKDADSYLALTTYECASVILMLDAMNATDAKPAGKRAAERLYPERPPARPEGSTFVWADWRRMHEAVFHIVERARNRNGLWRYWLPAADQDLSATQFVLLGLRAASRAGYPVPPHAWKGAVDGIRKFRADKGYAYQEGGSESDGMTGAAVASLVICSEQLDLAGVPAPKSLEPELKKAMARLDERFDVSRNQGSEYGYHYYYLYTMERVGDMTGRKEFNGTDWYVRGARFFLENQKPNGAFPDSTCMRPQDTLGTCFALLFLKRATPVAVTGSRD